MDNILNKIRSLPLRLKSLLSKKHPDDGYHQLIRKAFPEEEAESIIKIQKAITRKPLRNTQGI